jgi:8-oxo-dGTP pyrophosphatase MutT (NUDIX family)
VTVAPRSAATVCVVRDGPDGLEVLMVQRGEGASFMGGAWVFPGGVVDDLDGSDLARRAVTGGSSDAAESRWMAAGLRELVEEVRIWVTTEDLDEVPDGWLRDAEVYETALDLGVQLDAGRVAYFSNWVTPPPAPARFDTRFFAVVGPRGAVADPDPRELTAAEWTSPEAARSRSRTGEWVVPFPTMRTLEHLARFASAADFMDYARSLEDVPVVEPRFAFAEDGSVGIVLPWDPDYDELSDTDIDSSRLAEAIRDSQARGVPLPELGGTDES